MVVLDQDGSNGGSLKEKHYSLALQAYAAYHGYNILDMDLKNFLVNLLLPAEELIHKIFFAELAKAGERQRCSVIQSADKVADIFTYPVPIGLLREQEITYSETLELNNIDLFRDKIVLIGYCEGSCLSS